MTMQPKFKITFIGDQSTGKTSLITRFTHNTFDASYQATIGVDFMSKSISVAGNGNSSETALIRLQLWDSAGQERFHSLIPSYIRDSVAVVIVFDVCSRSSFASVTRWLDWVKREASEDVQIWLVGNKCDLSPQLVSKEEAAAYAESSHLLGFFPVSSKTGENVQLLFQSLGQKLLQKYQTSEVVQGVRLSHENPANNQCSC